MTLTSRQLRILMRLEDGDLLWEVPGEEYVSQYNERTGRELHVNVDIVNSLEALGLVRRVSAEGKLDCWQLTAQCRESIGGAERAAKRSKSPSPEVS